MSKNGQDRGAQRLRMARQTPRRLEISDAWHGYTRLQQPAFYSNRGLGDWANPDDSQASRGGAGGRPVAPPRATAGMSWFWTLTT